MYCRVIAVDVGSVHRNFAWAAIDPPSRHVLTTGTDPDSLIGPLCHALHCGTPVALGIEAPLAVPFGTRDSESWHTLGQARSGEVTPGASRPWSAGAGSGALATGLVQLTWILGQAVAPLPAITCTIDPRLWLTGDAQLFIWEAFVSGSDKPDGVRAETGPMANPHVLDAVAAAATFIDHLEVQSLASSDVTCAPARPLNLAATAAIRAGLIIDPLELTQDIHVYRTRRTHPSP